MNAQPLRRAQVAAGCDSEDAASDREAYGMDIEPPPEGESHTLATSVSKRPSLGPVHPSVKAPLTAWRLRDLCQAPQLSYAAQPMSPEDGFADDGDLVVVHLASSVGEIKLLSQILNDQEPQQLHANWTWF